jgi:outer membrane biosynthesis protein TonB
VELEDKNSRLNIDFPASKLPETPHPSLLGNMSSKRKYEEKPPQEPVHPSRQFQVPGSTPKPAKKPRKVGPSEPRKQAHASSVNAIKKRIRDVTRNLERSTDLPADVRVDSERALADYQQELAAAEAEKIRQKMIKKYHMVRFFGIQFPGHGSVTSANLMQSARKLRRP